MRSAASGVSATRRFMRPFMLNRVVHSNRRWFLSWETGSI